MEERVSFVEVPLKNSLETRDFENHVKLAFAELRSALSVISLNCFIR
jgi:hypothetical protein